MFHLSRKHLFYLSLTWCLGLLFTLFNPFEFLFLHLASTFIIHLLLLGIFITIRLAVKKIWLPAGIMLLPVLAFAANIAYAVNISGKTTSGSEDFSVLQANINFENRQIEEIISLVKALQPDIITFEEYARPHHVPISEKLASEYPYQISHPRYDGFGMLVLSKYPLARTEITEFNDKAIISTFITINEKDTHLLVFHPANPLSYRLRSDQRNEFDFLSQQINRQPVPLIVAGDFNAVPWYKEMITLTKEHNLFYSNTIFDWTFPSNLRFMAIPIDHILVSSDFNFSNTQTLKIPGSDHRGILSTLSFK